MSDQASSVFDHGLKVLLTAQDAYPELAALFLSAQDEILLSFRISDP